MRIVSPSSPYYEHIGIIDKPPFGDTFRFWYIVKFEAGGFAALGQFAEEELSVIEE